jgi:hypothetical protein
MNTASTPGSDPRFQVEDVDLTTRMLLDTTRSPPAGTGLTGG